MTDPKVQKRKRSQAALQTTFASLNPQWMDLAAKALFARDDIEKRTGEGYWLQNAVAEALKLAHEMGANGHIPPMPHGSYATYTERPIDPETEQIAQELRLLAWSPLAGTEAPEGYLAWNLRRRLKKPDKKAEEDTEDADTPQGGRVTVRRRKNAKPTTVHVRRTR